MPVCQQTLSKSLSLYPLYDNSHTLLCYQAVCPTGKLLRIGTGIIVLQKVEASSLYGVYILGG